MKYVLTFKQWSDALKQDKIMALKCGSCGALTVPPKMVCSNCASSQLEPVTMKGTGKIRTFTSVFVPAEGREKECPYVIVMVELDEGPWIMGNLKGVDPAKTSMDLIGKSVKMGHEVFAGDKYSAGEGARPMFSFS